MIKDQTVAPSTRTFRSKVHPASPKSRAGSISHSRLDRKSRHILQHTGRDKYQRVHAFLLHPSRKPSAHRPNELTIRSRSRDGDHLRRMTSWLSKELISDRMTRSPGTSPSFTTTSLIGPPPSLTFTRSASVPLGVNLNNSTTLSSPPTAGRPTNVTSLSRSSSITPSILISGLAPWGSETPSNATSTNTVPC